LSAANRTKSGHFFTAENSTEYPLSYLRFSPNFDRLNLKENRRFIKRAAALDTPKSRPRAAFGNFGG
jgi:hypothetical protein